jgi:hypothetical protein
MGDAMLGLVHPCKIYNIFAVGAPVIYIGPEPSHVTEAMAAVGGHLPFISVRHYEAARLADGLLRWSRASSFAGVRANGQTDAFSVKRLLPRLVTTLESIASA